MTAPHDIEIRHQWLDKMAARVWYKNADVMPRWGQLIDLGKFGVYMIVGATYDGRRLGGELLVQDEKFREEHPELKIERLHQIAEAKDR